jgi:acyl carrier protein phosphodiesterase
MIRFKREQDICRSTQSGPLLKESKAWSSLRRRREEPMAVENVINHCNKSFDWLRKIAIL